MLKIYGRAASINVRKVLWLVDEIGIPYEREDWGRGFKPLDTPEFRKLNPIGLIPAIDDDGFILRESNVIVRYLAAKHGRTDLYPADLKQRVTALNDQHLYLALDAGAGQVAGPATAQVRPGDVVGFGISHPCTTFDRWRVAAVVHGDEVVDLATVDL